jgi:hypothetical protein
MLRWFPRHRKGPLRDPPVSQQSFVPCPWSFVILDPVLPMTNDKGQMTFLLLTTDELALAGLRLIIGQ